MNEFYWKTGLPISLSMVIIFGEGICCNTVPLSYTFFNALMSRKNYLIIRMNG